MVLKSRSRSTKNPPILSHEFVIQNHEDIISCAAMVFIVGLMFQTTSPLASKFIALQHNATLEITPENPVFLYTNGIMDLCVIFFYFLICIVVHAIIQEFVIDKINKKLQLSKTKHSKFIESGQLLVFYIVSVGWAGHIIFSEMILTDVTSLWVGYPEEHGAMTFMYKFFFVTQISYWLHCYPELYFQKIKLEEWYSRIQYATIYLVVISAAYITNLTRVTLVLLLVHYAAESLAHASRMLHYAERSEIASKGFLLYNVVFTLARLVSIIASVLTFWYGLALNQATSIDVLTGNYNTLPVRVLALASVCLLQAWLMWNFITYHLRRMRELAALNAPAKKPAFASKKDKKTKEKKSKKHEDDELPEVDQNTNKQLRQRK